MENARLHGQTVRRSRDLEALYRADEALYRSLRLDQVLQALVDVATDVLQADMTSVLVWDERHEQLIPGATRGFRPEVVAQMSHAPGEGITTRVALSGEPIAVEDAPNDPRVAHRITDAEGIQLAAARADQSQRRSLRRLRRQLPPAAHAERRRGARAAGAGPSRRAWPSRTRGCTPSRSSAGTSSRRCTAPTKRCTARCVWTTCCTRWPTSPRDVLHADKTSVHIWDAEHGSWSGRRRAATAPNRPRSR